MQKDIDIDEHGNAPDCELHRANHDTANWINRGKIDRVVRFGPKDSPFAPEYEFFVTAGGSTGPKMPTIGGQFQYSIPAARASNEPAADPRLIVH
jgi:hypothetical protein